MEPTMSCKYECIIMVIRIDSVFHHLMTYNFTTKHLNSKVLKI